MFRTIDELLCEVKGEEVSQKVSIIMCFYNAERTLERSIRGIVDQTYRNIEFILIDDGSTDGSSVIAKQYADVDDRIKLICKSNTGVSDSRNIGLDAATGDWVYFVDADDWIMEDAVEAFMDAASNPTCDLVVCDFYRVQGDVMSRKEGPAVGLVSREKYASFMSRRPSNFYYTSLWNKVFKLDLINEHHMRFDNSMHFGEDHVFILQYIMLVDRVALLDRALYYYVDNAGSLVHQGLNPAGIVKMKWNTYLPYLRLYRDLGLYEKFYQRPNLYKFIFMPSTDAFARKDAEPVDPRALPKCATMTLATAAS